MKGIIIEYNKSTGKGVVQTDNQERYNVSVFDSVLIFKTNLKKGMEIIFDILEINGNKKAVNILDSRKFPNLSK